MSARPYDPERIRALALSDSGFVFDPRTGHSYSVNPTGHALLRAMKEGLSVEEAAQKLEEQFEAEGNPVQDDVEDFLNLLRELGLAERPAPSGELT